MAKRAKARLLYPEISLSERLGALGSKAALVYTWLLPAADDQGRVEGSPRRIKTLMLPFVDDVSVGDIQEALTGLESAGMVILYADDHDRSLIQIMEWFEYQGGLRHKNPSRHRPPPGWEDQVTEKVRDDRGRFTPQTASAPEVACPECGVVGQPTKSDNVLICSACKHYVGEYNSDGSITWRWDIKPIE